jgi:putative Mg2+ transporter-C (MgtC) family protein
MPLTLGWGDISVRLALTFLAGVVLGFDRTERGKAAGVCTTTLVALAAAVSMIQANLLMVTTGKSANSFVVLDLMRLPLGILTGVGFIGGGAILRRENMVRGVTTAAILWFVTVIGLCFGGGQLELGLAGLGLAVLVLWGLKWIERQLTRDCTAKLFVRCSNAGPGEQEIRTSIAASNCRIKTWGMAQYGEEGSRGRAVRCEVLWRAQESETHPPPFVNQLRRHPGVLMLRWES